MKDGSRIFSKLYSGERLLPSLRRRLYLLGVEISMLWTRQTPYVPTEPRLVDAMLQAARVTKDDVLYDLGCGDGRICVAAAKKYGVRAVGLDIDPKCISKARRNAERAGVTDRVRFLQEDFLGNVDISEATVVTLFLLPTVNLRLRPKLLRELRPGTRILSNSFDMGSWMPERAVEVGWRMIFCWVVPPTPRY